MFALALFPDTVSAQQFVPIAPLFFNMPAGGANPLPQTLTLASTGASFYFSSVKVTAKGATTGVNWLSVKGCGGCYTPGAYSVGIDATALPVGTYQAQIDFSNGATANVSVPVTLTITASNLPLLGNICGALTFVAGNGFNPASQYIEIFNAGSSGALDWTAIPSTSNGASGVNSNWLGISIQRGTAPSTVIVSVSTQGLSPGVYIGQLLFQSANGSITIPVRLVITDTNNVTFQQVPEVRFITPAGGTNPLPQTITLASTGPNFYFTSVTATTGSGGDWLSVGGCSGCYTPAVYSIRVNAINLPVGTYPGQVVFSDGSAAVTVPVLLKVADPTGPFLSNSSGGLSFVSGNGFNPAPQNVPVVNAGAGTLNWTAAVSAFRGSTVGVANWLSVSAPGGTTPAIVTVSVSTQGLVPGIYLGQVLFQAATGSITIPVSLEVTDVNNVTFQQLPEAVFTMPAGGPNPLGKTLTLASTGADFYYTSVTVTTGSGGDWLSVTGCRPGCYTPEVYSVNVNAANLPAGTYAGQVLFSSGGAAITAPVVLTVVSAGSPFFGATPGGLSFVSGSGFVPASQNVQIANGGTGTLNWTAAVSIFRSSAIASVNWLSVSAPSGTAPSIVTVSVSTQGLAPGVYLGQVLFQATTGSMTVPVSLEVTDSKNITFQQLPEAIFTMPAGGPNPLAQTLTLASTGADFYYTSVAATTGAGGDWLSVTGCTPGCYTPGVYSVNVSAANLPTGTYAGELLFSSGAAEKTVPVVLTVASTGSPFFGAAPGGLSFVSGSGFVPASQNIQITNGGTGTLNWTAAVSIFRSSTVASTNWLSISALSGTAPSIMTVSVSTQGLGPGVYLGQVLFQAATGNMTIPVSLEVTDSKNITFEQLPGLNFTMPVGGSNPLAQTLILASTGADLYYTSATATTGSGGDWLSVTGCRPGCNTPEVYSVIVKAANLLAGTYAGQVVFSSGSTAMTVPVVLTVASAGGPFFGAVTGGLNLVSGSGFLPASQNVQITNAGTGVLNWTATVSVFRSSTVVSANWLSVSAPSGTAPSIVTVSVSPQGLAPGVYLGQVLFQAESSNITIPVSLEVTDNSNITFEQLSGLNFTMPVGGPNPQSQNLAVTSTGSDFHYDFATASTGAGGNWLTLTGCNNGCNTPSVYKVSVNAASLGAGIYVGQVVFIGSTAMTVPVTLTVGNPSALATTIASNYPSLAFNYTKGGGEPPAYFLTISSINPSTGVAYTTFLGSGCSWFDFTPGNGTTKASDAGIHAALNTAVAAGLQPGTYSCTITIAAPGASNSPLTVPVSLVVGFPLLTITTTSLPTALVGLPYGPVQLGLAGATGATVWSATGLPVLTGLNLSPGGILSGIPLRESEGVYLLTVKATNSGTTATAQLTLTINAASTLDVLNFHLVPLGGASLSDTRIFVVGNDSSSPATVKVVPSASWIKTSTSQIDLANGAAPKPVSVQIDRTALPPGTSYASGTISLQGLSSPKQVEVNVALQDQRGLPLLSRSAMTFYIQQRQLRAVGDNLTQTVTIINDGPKPVGWNIESSDPIVSVNPPISTTRLQPGDFASVQVTVSDRDLTILPSDSKPRQMLLSFLFDDNSLTEFPVSVVVSQAALPSELLLDQTGLIFVGTEHQSIGIENYTLNDYSVSIVPLQSWIKVSPTSTIIRAPSLSQIDRNRASFDVSVDPTAAPLDSGLARGWIVIGYQDPSKPNVTVFSQQVEVLYLGAQTVSGAGLMSLADGASVAACQPSSLRAVFSRLSEGATVALGLPAQIDVKVADNCGNAVKTGAAAVSFSNGDPPVTLLPDGNGSWQGTWSPRSGKSAVLFMAAVSGQQFAFGTATRSVQLDSTGVKLPSVPRGAILNAASLTPSVDRVAPGSIISIFGDQLATETAAASSVLPYSLGSTTVRLGKVELPLFYVSPTQINALVTAGMQLDPTTSLVVESGGVQSIPVPVVSLATDPGIFSGAVVSATGKVNSQSAPAQRGDTVVIYCTGLGSVTESLDPTLPAPLNHLVYTKQPVAVFIQGSDGQSLSAYVSFAGLAPGYSGLYQVNVQIPDNAATGDQVVLYILSGARESNHVPISIR